MNDLTVSISWVSDGANARRCSRLSPRLVRAVVKVAAAVPADL